MVERCVDAARHYAVVSQAIAFIRTRARNQPTLEEVAHAVHMSPHHLQRVFTHWAGISPKRFLQYLTKEYARQRLAQAHDVLRVTHDAGLSSASRLHDLMVTCEALTPGEIKAAGAGVAMTFGFAASPFGKALCAWTPRGVCHLAFCDADDAAMLDDLRAAWPRALLARDDAAAEELLQRVFPRAPGRGALHLLLRGTNFQIQVWQALLQVRFSQLASYGRLARELGMPGAQRALGSALAANTLAYLIPCHRVIRETGIIGPYRWGSERKAAMVGWEASMATAQQEAEPAAEPSSKAKPPQPHRANA